MDAQLLPKPFSEYTDGFFGLFGKYTGMKVVHIIKEINDAVVYKIILFIESDNSGNVIFTAAF